MASIKQVTNDVAFSEDVAQFNYIFKYLMFTDFILIMLSMANSR